MNIPNYKTNERIKSEELRVVDEKGENLGVIKTSEALRIAKERELDLVEVSPKAKPPVAKIIDFGNFKYQKEKEARKQKAQSKEVEVKGVRLSPRIGEHDLNIRLKQAKKFLERGDKVKIEMVLRGREKRHNDYVLDIVKEFIEKIKLEFDGIRVEQEPKKQGNRVTAIIGR